jgi:tripartite-type tricarboxylate transporter receptor subunit TctC
MKLLLGSLLLAVSLTSQARETITILVGAGPTQPNSTALRKTVEVANEMQNDYSFVVEFKPGGNGVIALKAMDLSPTNRLATVAPAYVENVRVGLINENDYVPIQSQGDACWAIITNVGNTQQGLAAHTTALILGEEYGFKVRFIVYKANFDALVNMAAGENINFVFERVASYETFKAKNPKLQILGINCKQRSKAMPKVRTLEEQGFATPTVFFAMVASVNMPTARRNEIAAILEKAQIKLGQQYFMETADVNPPEFNKLTAAEFFNMRVLQMKVFTHRYEQQINQAR